MNAQLRSELLTEPRPAEARDVRVTLGDRGWRCVWILDGKTSEPFGPPFAMVSDAAAAARLVREAHQL
jgi:hypothetical protein